MEVTVHVHRSTSLSDEHTVVLSDSLSELSVRASWMHHLLYSLYVISWSLVGVYCEGVKGVLTLLTGLQNGVTHLLISPDGNTLHAGYRKVCLPRYLWLAVCLTACVWCSLTRYNLGIFVILERCSTRWSERSVPISVSTLMSMGKFVICVVTFLSC